MYTADAYAKRTTKQRGQLAKRYDREARETLQAAEAQRAQEARAVRLKRARKIAEEMPLLIVRGKKDGSPLSQSELTCCKDMMQDAWATLIRHGEVVAI